MNSDTQQPTPSQPDGSPSSHPDDTDVTIAAPARAGTPIREATPETDERTTSASNPANTSNPASEEAQPVPANLAESPMEESAPLPQPAQIVQPATPANFPPPLPATPPAQGVDPNGLTYRDLAPPHSPHSPQAWQAPPVGQPRQPTPPRPARGQPTPPPTHVPWQVASSWGATTLSIQANTAAGASYLLWWLSGLLVYFNERHNRFVRFHAMQSILLSCVFTVYGIVVYLVSGLLYDLAAATNQYSFHRLGTFIAALSFFAILVPWLFMMIAAWTGHYIRVPILGRYAERYAAPPAQPPQY